MLDLIKDSKIYETKAQYQVLYHVCYFLLKINIYYYKINDEEKLKN